MPTAKRRGENSRLAKSPYCGQSNWKSQTLAALYEQNHLTRSWDKAKLNKNPATSFSFHPPQDKCQIYQLNKTFRKQWETRCNDFSQHKEKPQELDFMLKSRYYQPSGMFSFIFIWMCGTFPNLPLLYLFASALLQAWSYNHTNTTCFSTIHIYLIYILVIKKSPLLWAPKYLSHCVLDWGPSQQQSVSTLEL